MKEKEQYISNLKLQVQELKDEHKAQLESYEQGICKLAWEVEELRSKLEREEEKCKQLLEEENEWGDELVGMLDGLEEKIRADKQKGFNDQFYTPTGDISSEPDNVPRKKIELSRSLSFDSEFGNESYVPQERDNDSAYDSNEENCDNDLSSNISSISSVEKLAESRKVGNLLSSCIIWR
ncbi:hypothetical protein [Wolbachia endosymbiont of Encarsia formosa]|uniref:hypothetical protein n=1 Tax=Wolbachia endosymbiont of Encarsia formosa TaxID=77125 RepID=UPI0031BA4E82